MSSTDITTPLISSPPAATTQQPFTSAFPVIPVTSDNTSPDFDNLTLVDDLADFANDQVPSSTVTGAAAIAAQDNDLEFDWLIGEPMNMPATGNVTWITDLPQILQWFRKALVTPRGRYAIYAGSNFGSNLAALIGTVPSAALNSEITRDVTETALAHPRIVSCSVLSIASGPGPNGLMISVVLGIDAPSNQLAMQVPA